MREALPIAGSVVGGYFRHRLSLWRRALIWLAHAGLPKPKLWAERESPELFHAGPLGSFVDPGAPKPAQPAHMVMRVGEGVVLRGSG